MCCAQLGSTAASAAQVFNDRTAQADIDAVHSMGIFDNISITPQYAEDSTLEQPKVRFTVHISSCRQLCSDQQLL